jgi:hypothetical protein
MDFIKKQSLLKTEKEYIKFFLGRKIRIMTYIKISMIKNACITGNLHNLRTKIEKNK